MRDYMSPLTGTSYMEARGEGFLNLVRGSQRLSGRRPELEQIGHATKLTIYAATYEGRPRRRMTGGNQCRHPDFPSDRQRHGQRRTAGRARSDGLPGKRRPGARRPSGRRGAQTRCRSRNFAPDALWRSDSALTVYFKHAPEAPSDEQVADWRREIWNQGFAPLLWVVSPQRIDLYNGFGRPAGNRRHGCTQAPLVPHNRARVWTSSTRFAGRLAMETGRFWQQADNVNRRTSVDSQLLSDLAVLERDLVKAGQGPH